MDTPLPVTPPPTHRDRRTGLIIFGILEIILGGFIALTIPFMILGLVMAAKKTDGNLDPRMMGSSLFTLVASATTLIWLGIGSIMCRRWARALLLCLGWMGLCVGAVSIVVLPFTLSSMSTIAQQSGQELPPAALIVAKVVTVVFSFIFYVVIPGSLVLFYRSRNVKLTCEQRDPIERWTDRCPLPVIAMCLVQAYGGISMLLMPGFWNAVPLAGIVITGWPARLYFLGFVVFSLYSAWGFYRLNLRTWLLYTVAIVVVGISSAITFLRIDLADYYKLSGLREAQIRQITANPLFQSNHFAWFCLFGIGLFAGYLLYLRRFFTGKEAAPKL